MPLTLSCSNVGSATPPDEDDELLLDEAPELDELLDELELDELELVPPPGTTQTGGVKLVP